MKAPLLLAENLAELLRRHHATQHDLAHWCRKSDPWLGNILKGKRGLSVDDLDRIADFFGYAGAIYKLFMPGVASTTERRRVNRRNGKERRIGWQGKMAEELRSEVAGVLRPRSYARDSVSAEAAAAIAKVETEFARRLDRIVAEDARRQTARSRQNKPATRQGSGTRGGSDAPPA